MKLEKAIKLQETNAPAFLYAVAAAAFAAVAAMPIAWVGDTLGVHSFFGSKVLIALAFTVVLVVLSKSRPQQHIAPVILISIGALGASAFINIIPQLSLTFALIGAYGFAGILLNAPRWWSANLAIAILIALALPFGVSSQTGFGFFMRVAVTDVAAQLLNLFGMTFLSSHDVLIFENGLARIDAPCSGLKSIFTGSAFFLAASAVLRKRISLHWLMAYAAFVTLVITGNVARIVILVTLVETYDAAALAELFHIPIGLVFFVLACAVGTWLLTRIEQPEMLLKQERRSGRNVTFYSLIPLFAIGLALFLAPDRSEATTLQPNIPTPTSAAYERLALTSAEERFYNTHPHTSAKKWRFETGALSGSIIIVRSTAVTAMHAPEICFEANGFDIHGMETRRLSDGKTFRELSIGDAKMRAVYWMQSRSTVTDSFTERLKRYALHGENDWLMATILFDNDPNLTTKVTTSHVNELEQQLDDFFTEEEGFSNE